MTFITSHVVLRHLILGVSKNVQVLTVSEFDKIDVVNRFRETIPTVKFVSSSESRKIPDFDQNYDFAIFQKIEIFSGLTNIVLIYFCM